MLTVTVLGAVQVLSIVTVAVAFVAMAGSIFGMNLYFNVTETPPVSLQTSMLEGGWSRLCVAAAPLAR